MNVYEYAMKVEKEGEKYYRDLAQKTEDMGLKQVLTMLADEEVKHYATFEAMLGRAPLPSTPSVDIFKGAKTIFQKMKATNPTAVFTKEQVDFYTHALALEEKSYAFYIEKAELLEDAEEKAAFLRIAEEEKQHATLLENLIEYITYPERWIEDAEFNRLSEPRAPLSL
ncbi:MAG: ferritin family protein [Campylobacterales bacterium]|nr:ferritin family protein [Campylobacterales bacterium]